MRLFGLSMLSLQSSMGLLFQLLLMEQYTLSLIYIGRRMLMAKMAGLHAEGLTDADLEEVELVEILKEVLID
jgi:hypothetical protein